MSRADSIKILYQELKTGILSLTDIQEQVDMNKKQVLDLHKKMYNYWQGKNGKWYSYLPKEGVDKPKEYLNQSLQVCSVILPKSMKNIIPMTHQILMKNKRLSKNVMPNLKI